jgi:hypothetical protein
MGYRMRISVLDIIDDYKYYIDFLCEHVKFIQDDIFKLQRSYDIVLCSHVIEHVPNPAEFVGRLREISKGTLLVQAPFDEPVEGRTKGHINSFTMSDLEAMEPESIELIESPAWGAFMEPRYKVFVAQFRGTDTSGVRG